MSESLGPGSSGERTAADLAVEALELAGVTAWFDGSNRTGRRPIAEALDRRAARLTEAPDADTACLLADAHGYVNGGLGAAILDEQLIHVSSEIGGVARPTLVQTAAELVEVCAQLPGRWQPATAALAIEMDLAEACPSNLEALTAHERLVAVQLPVGIGAGTDLEAVVVAGIGVLRTNSLGQLRLMAARSGLEVLTTVDGRGLVPRESRHDGGAVGAQSGDAELAGLRPGRIVVTTGLKSGELDDQLSECMVIDVDPRQLEFAVQGWDQPPERAHVNADSTRLAERFADLIRPLYEPADGSLHPARAALHMAGAARDGGVICATGDAAGLWLTRAMPIEEAGSLVVTKRSVPGAPVAAAIVARLADRPAVAVCHDIDTTSAGLIRWARAAGIGIGTQVWTSEVAGSTLTPAAHAQLSVQMATCEEVRMEVVNLAVEDTEPLVSLAGQPIGVFLAAD